jgi:hypothetical protein
MTPEPFMSRSRSAIASAALLLAALAAAQPPTVIRPGTPAERPYLVEDHSALREVGYDPLCPFTRIADGRMSYTYRFAAGRGQRAWLLVKVSSQFLILARGEGGEFRPVADMDRAEYVGTRVFVDLTPLLADAEAVLVRFEDKHKDDGWGALTSEILYYHEDQPGPTRLEGSPAAGQPWTFNAPPSWAGCELAVYLAAAQGPAPAVELDRQPLVLGHTWDGGWWADVSRRIRPGAPQTLVVQGPARTARVGLRLPACATVQTNHAFAPYQPEMMDCLAGNFMQSLLDTRYDLLAFAPGERQPIHFVHDTLRSLSALALEAEHTPVWRPELAQHLYRGCRAAILPGGERLLAFKHDERPIDIRPLAGSHDLTLVHKLDEGRTVAAVGLTLAGAEAEAVADTPAVAVDGGTELRRSWSFGPRRVEVTAFYPPGDADRPPRFEFNMDGGGPLQIHLRQLASSGMWFVPGCWGAEAIVTPDGAEHWAHTETLAFDHPAWPYLLLQGGNTGEYTFCRALLAAWDRPPDRLSVALKPGGRHGKLIDDLVLEYANDRPGRLRLVVYPFTGYPEGLQTPRAIADSIGATGKLGCGVYDPVFTATADGLGPEAIAAAAWLLKRAGLPEAGEAEALAVQMMRDTLDRERRGVRTEQLYYLVDAPRRLAALGHPEFLDQTAVWGQRILAMQRPDGSYQWLDQQFRMMIALLKLADNTGDARYRAAFDRAAATVSYRDDRLYWKGQAQSAGDFAGALPFGIDAHLGQRQAAATVLRSRAGLIDDRGFQACSDLNPYMLGFAFAGWGQRSEKQVRLSLTEFATYSLGPTAGREWPTAYVVNPWQPFGMAVGYPLP